MSWLSHLPHQIPFRAASAVHRVNGKTIEGVYVCTADDILPTGVMALEAMAQFAGGLVLEQQGFLMGMDRCELSRVPEPGDILVCTVTLEAELGGTFRFNGVATIDGVEALRGRFYLASSTDAQT